MKKNKGLTKLLAVLALSSTAFIFAGCGKNKVTTRQQEDDETKYDPATKMKYKISDVTGGKEVEIVEIGKQGTKLVIPKTLGGGTVTRVSCTYSDEELEEVEIPSTLKYLTGNGFMDCKNLSTVTFEAGAQITDIPSKAFLNTKISSITIPASVRSISFEAFQDIDTLSSVTFESGSKLQSIGPFAFYGCDSLTNISLPSELVSIGGSAFEKCENLSTLTISNATKLELIDVYAFSGCTKITSLDFSSNTALTKIGANAFRGCTNLSSVTFDTALREIGSKAFYNTQKITDLVLPENLLLVGDEAFVNAGIVSLEIKSGSDTTFGVNAFTQYLVNETTHTIIPRDDKIISLKANGNLSLDKIFTDYAKQVRMSLETLNVTGDRIAANAYKGCINLTDLNIENTIKAIGESAFEDCTLIKQVDLYEGLNEISKDTFKNCVSLKTIALPSTVTIVRQGAFDGCVKVDNLDLSRLTIIGASAFRNTLIATPTFSDSIQTIGDYAFDNCVNIEEVVIDTVDKVSSTTIRQYAFNNCKNITNINLSSNVVLESNAFANDTNVENLVVRGEYGMETLFGESKKDAARKIKTIVIQDNTETIENSAFYGCLLVTTLIIPDTVKRIGDEAFRGCKGITTLNLPDELERIGKYAFAECDKLVLTELPSAITEISEGMFQSDFSIGEFTLSENIKRIGDNSFRACSNVDLKVEVINPDAEVEDQVTNIDQITYIGSNAFSGCLNLKIDKLPNELVELGDNAFDGCLAVKFTKTTDKLEEIGNCAFKGCQSITSFEFVKDLTLTDSLGEAVLDGCTKIEELKIYGTTSLEFLFGSSVSKLKPVLSKIILKGNEIELADNMFKGFSAISSVVLEEQGVDEEGKPLAEITSIGESAFEECISLTTFDISKVVRIGDRAFAGSGLITIEIPSNGILLGEGVFSGCTSLSELTFADPSDDDKLNIKAIPDKSFEGTIIVDVVLPDTVTSIGQYAFSYISTLNSFTISSNSELVSINDYAFTGCSNILNFDIPAKVSLIGEHSFEECTALRNVSFADTCKIEKISLKAFSGCYALTYINLPDTIREIGDFAFENCTCLVGGADGFKLPETLEILGVAAFYGCQSLNDITIPEKIEIICSQTFSDCYMLENVIWNSNIKIIYEEAFFNTPYKTPIPNTVFEIHDSAFASEKDKPATFSGMDIELGNDSDGVSLTIYDKAFNRSAVRSVVFGAKIVEIGSNAFAESLIEAVDFTNLKITKIGDYMFDQCAGLNTVTMTGNTTINTIGDAAFKETAITSFDFSNILSIGESAFEAAKDLDISVSLGVNINVTIGDKAFFQSGIKGLTLGAKVIKLGNDVFAENENIESADLSGLNITAISDSFFADCKALKTVSINSHIRTIGAKAFFNTAIEDISFLEAAIDLEQIMDSAFESCKKLENAIIPNTVSYVGEAAFKECTELLAVTWSNSANVIRKDTFNGCAKMNGFTVPANVSRIGELAFNLTSGTPVITFMSTTPPSVHEQFVSDYAAISFVVPAGSLTAYMKNYVFAKLAVNISEA